MSLTPRHSLMNMDSYFDHFFSPMSLGHQESEGYFFTPRVDLKEKGDFYEISLELAGVKKEDIHVSIDNGILTIEAERKQKKMKEKDGSIIRQERRYGKCMRTFDLGSDVKQRDVDGHFENGVLMLTVPRINQRLENRKEIEIH